MRWWRKTKVELVKGGDLEVGDIVLIPCRVEKVDMFSHPIARPVSGTHWNVGDQELWTWGGLHGAGIDIPPGLYRLVEQ